MFERCTLQNKGHRERQAAITTRSQLNLHYLPPLIALGPKNKDKWAQIFQYLAWHDGTHAQVGWVAKAKIFLISALGIRRAPLCSGAERCPRRCNQADEEMFS